MGEPFGTPRNDSETSVRLCIGSRLELLELVYSLIEGLGRNHGWSEETVTALQIAVIEAGTNAIQHGNLFAEDKSVTFEFRLERDGVEVQVDDYGKGFDPTRVGDPTDASALLSPHGRGIYLMRSLMDDVAIDVRPDHGTRVRLRKESPGASA